MYSIVYGYAYIRHGTSYLGIIHKEMNGSSEAPLQDIYMHIYLYNTYIYGNNNQLSFMHILYDFKTIITSFYTY